MADCRLSRVIGLDREMHPAPSRPIELRIGSDIARVRVRLVASDFFTTNGRRLRYSVALPELTL